MLNDYYSVLGVSHDASLSQITRAYNRLLKKFDAEHLGDESHDRFVQLRNAYESLSSVSRRNEHEIDMMPSRSTPRTDSLFEPAFDLLHTFERFSPSQEEIRETIEQNFTAENLPKSRVVRELTVEVMLTPEQIAQGGSVPIDFPVVNVCSACTGSGVTGHYLCDDCGGQGIDWASQRIDVVLPKHINDGAMIPVSLKHLGVTNLYLNLLVRVPSTVHGASA